MEPMSLERVPHVDSAQGLRCWKVSLASIDGWAYCAEQGLLLKTHNPICELPTMSIKPRVSYLQGPHDPSIEFMNRRKAPQSLRHNTINSSNLIGARPEILQLPAWPELARCRQAARQLQRHEAGVRQVGPSRGHRVYVYVRGPL